jgi:AraC-like DNA-binding protein
MPVRQIVWLLRYPSPRGQANRMLYEMTQEHDLLKQVRRLILMSLDTQTITAVQASERLNIPVRSLHRHLSGSGSSFKILREEVVIKAAEEALRETDLSIATIASELNYSEASAFDRMFKRLKGTTPREYRKKAKLRDRII